MNLSRLTCLGHKNLLIRKTFVDTKSNQACSFRHDICNCCSTILNLNFVWPAQCHTQGAWRVICQRSPNMLRTSLNGMLNESRILHIYAFISPLKMLLLNAPFFPLKCSSLLPPRRSLKCSVYAHARGF